MKGDVFVDTRRVFNTDLQELSDALIRMGAAATNAVDRALEALLAGDKDLARKIVEDDNIIDEMERNIEHRCLHLLLRQQPVVAGDLREVSTAIKMITDIERIGDAAADISEINLHLERPVFLEIAEDLVAMARAARSMVSSSIEAYVKADLELANKTRAQDDIVDGYFLKIRNALGEIMRTDAEDMDAAIDYLMIIKYFERIGDHAENICEWVEFDKTGIHKRERIL